MIPANVRITLIGKCARNGRRPPLAIWKGDISHGYTGRHVGVSRSVFKCRRVRAVVVPAEPHRNCYSIRAANSISHANYLCGFFFAHFSMALETMRFSAVECGIISSPRSMRACVCVWFFSGLCVTHANRGSVRPKIQTEKTHTGLMQMGRMYCVCVCVRTVGVRMCGKYATPGRLVFNRRHTALVHGAHDVLGL